MPCAGGERRFISRAAVIILVALVAYVAVTAIRFVFMYNDMVEAKGLLVSVEATLQQEGLDTTPVALAEAETQAASARSKFRSAQDFLEGDPLLRVAGWMPGLGSQVSAVRDLAGIGYEGSEIGLSAIDVLETFNAVKADEEGVPGEKVVEFLDDIEPQMTVVEERLGAIRERRDSIDSRWTLPQLSGFVQQLDAWLPSVEQRVAEYRHGKAVADQLLGFDGPRSYLVLGLDNTELLPGGGLIGVYGLITLHKGRVVERFFGEVEDVIHRWQERTGGEYIEPPAPLKRYLLRDWTWNLGVANWSPDFSVAAPQALFFYDRSGADPADGVIAIDFVALEGLLATLGPLEVDGYEVTVDSASVTEEILTHISKDQRQGGQPHAFAQAVAGQVMDSALTVDSGKLASLLDTLNRLAEEKHLFLYATDSQLQSSLEGLGWAGEVRAEPGDYLMAVNASVHSTKLNLVLDERMQMDVQLDAGGRARHTVTLTYENQLSDWARLHDPQVVSDLMLTGFYGGYLRLLTPPQAQLLDLYLDGQTVGAEDITQELGKASFGRYFPLPKDRQAALSFIYEVPAVVDISQGDHEYRLLIQKQPGTGTMPLKITIGLPSGAKAKSVSLDGQILPDRTLEIETELSVDRELVVRYEP
jgi:hypothetical protein